MKMGKGKRKKGEKRKKRRNQKLNERLRRLEPDWLVISSKLLLFLVYLLWIIQWLPAKLDDY